MQKKIILKSMRRDLRTKFKIVIDSTMYLFYHVPSEMCMSNILAMKI
jgi:hypothetical protein